MDTLDLSDFFKTKAQANDFSSRLATVFKAIYHTDFHLEKTLMDEFGIEKKDKFMTLLRENNIPLDSIPPLKDFLTKMQEKIATLSVLPITLAFEPKGQTLQILSDWFQLNIKRQVLFDITIDRNLIAGAAITFNGKYMDFSITSIFQETVKHVLTPPPPETKQAPTAPALHQDAEHMHLGR